MTTRRTPTESHDRDAETDAAIHDTQTSMETVRLGAPDTDASKDADTLLSGPTPEDDLHAELSQRLERLELAVSRLEARVRLLEKQDPIPPSLLRWLLALLFFVALAVSWQLIATLR